MTSAVRFAIIYALITSRKQNFVDLTFSAFIPPPIFFTHVDIRRSGGSTDEEKKKLLQQLSRVKEVTQFLMNQLGKLRFCALLVTASMALTE